MRLKTKTPKRSTIEAESTITDRRSKEVVHTKATKKLGKPIKPVEGKVVGYVRFGDNLKITKKYQSTGTEITAEVPFMMTPGDLSELPSQIEEVMEVIDDVLAEHLKDLKEALSQLAKEDGR